MGTLGRYSVILVSLLFALTGYSQNMRTRSSTTTFATTNFGHSTYSNLTASTAVTAPAAGSVVLLASNNTLFSLSSAGVLTDLGAAGSGLSDGDKGDITVSASGATFRIDREVKITNSYQYAATNIIGTNEVYWADSGGRPQLERSWAGAGTTMPFIQLRNDDSPNKILYLGNNIGANAFNAVYVTMDSSEDGNTDARFRVRIGLNDTDYVWDIKERGLVLDSTAIGKQLWFLRTDGNSYQFGSNNLITEIQGWSITLKTNATAADTFTASSTIVHNGADQFKILTNTFSGFNVFLDLATNTMQFLLATNNFTLIPTNQNVGQRISFTMFNPTATSVTIVLPAVQIYGSGISNVVAAGKRLKTAWESQDAAVTNVSAAFAQQKN